MHVILSRLKILIFSNTCSHGSLVVLSNRVGLRNVPYTNGYTALLTVTALMPSMVGHGERRHGGRYGSVPFALYKNRSNGIRGFERFTSLDTLCPSRIDLPLISRGIIILVVVVVTAGGGINNNGRKSKGFNSRFGTRIENCSLIFRTLSIWASV